MSCYVNIRYSDVGGETEQETRRKNPIDQKIEIQTLPLTCFMTLARIQWCT